jgi:hypothetical protein
MTSDEKKLLDVARRLESQKCREDLMWQAEAMVRAQEALKADYGLMGPDAPQFNGPGAGPEVPPVRARRGSTAPVLA